MEPGQVVVEFYGIPRQRAGRAELAVPAGTLGEVLTAVERACPELQLRYKEGIAPHLRISIEGGRFVSELGEMIEPGSRVLILSADVGG